MTIIYYAAAVVQNMCTLQHIVMAVKNWPFNQRRYVDFCCFL